MDKNELERIIRDKLQEILTTEKEDTFMVEASGRHVHLTKEHVEALFGEGYELTPVKDLSQPGQFAAKERVRVIGPKGEFSSVAILGPCRNFSQVELSLTDCREIGVKGVIRESGKIEGTPGILIGVGDKYIQLDKGLIVARKIEKTKSIEIAKSALDRVGLSDRYDYYPSKLSGGQQQRVGIARAIAASPKLILFDEPTSALDTELVGEVLKVMKKLAEDGVTMVVVSHEIDFAREVANKVMFIDDGRVIEEGIPREVLNNPKELRTRQFLSRVLHKD